jgi:hypothetical protein
MKTVQTQQMLGWTTRLQPKPTRKPETIFEAVGAKSDLKSLFFLGSLRQKNSAKLMAQKT